MRALKVYLCFCLLFGGHVQASGAPGSSKGGPGQAERTTPEPLGKVRGIVFAQSERDAPKAGVDVTLSGPEGGGRSKTTNSDGAVMFKVPKGRYRVTVSLSGRRGGTTVEVMPGQTVEVLVTIRRDGTVSYRNEIGKKTRATKIERASKPKGPRYRRSGVVLHEKKRTPIVGARIFARGTHVEAQSDSKGRFVVSLPKGTYDLTVIHPRFGTKKVSRVKVGQEEATRGERGELEILMTPIALRLRDFTVSAPRIVGNTATLMLARKKSRMVTDVIGAEEMAKGGAGDAAGALRRVTGITVIGGKYVYVRGLGERYSSTLLNGSTLPSPEPERRVVPLDMFPTALLENVVIQKNYSPDLPGEFGGGAVKLNTRGFPGQFTASVSLSLGFVGGTTFMQGLKSGGGKLDFLGIDDGTRALPKPVERASDKSPLMERDIFSQRGYTAQELERFGELMPNIWNLHRGRVAPNLGFTGTVGDTFKLFGLKAGYLAALTYDNDWGLKDRRLNFYVVGSGDRLELAHSYDLEELTNTITLAGILAFGVDLTKAHKLRFTSLVDRITDNENRRYEGENRDVGTRIRVTRVRWVERMLTLHQARGTHAVGLGVDLNLNWRYTFSMALRSEPDRREVRYDQELSQPDLWLLSDRPDGNGRLFSELVDKNHDLGVDVGMRIKRWGWLDLKLKAGLAFTLKSRGVDTRRYKFKHKGPLSGDSEVIGKRPEAVFLPEHIGPDGFQFEEITRQTDNYSAEQVIWAAYTMVDWTLLGDLFVTAGLRVEASRQYVKTFELFNPDNEPVESKLKTVDALPIGGISWKPDDKHVLRLFYGRTLSRPDFRELSPATFNDVTGGRQIYGNPELDRATIENLDLRWEWYPSRGENLSFAFFYKYFNDPIESVVIVSAQHSVTYENASGAHNVGAELTGRKRLGFLHPWARDLYVAGNMAVIWSRVVLPEDSGIQTSSSRPLQGQSPFVFNLQLGYDDVDKKTTVALLYNVFGERIQQVGALGAPDILEQPFHRLDLVYRQGLGRGFTLKLKATNLLDLPVKLEQGHRITEVYRRGRVFSLGVSKKF